MKTIWDGRENNFDFIRLALAVLVIGSHSYPLGTGTEAAEPIGMLTHGQVTGGAISVDLFFIMSGFLITASAERTSSIASFLKKRFLRIYPAFIAGMLLAAFVVVPLSSARFISPNLFVNVFDFIVSTLRLLEFHTVGAFPSNPYPGSINGSVWSIAFEFWCYIGVAPLSITGMLRRRAAVFVLWLATLVVSILFRAKGWIVGGKILGVIFGYPVFWARLLPLYLAGVVFYLYRDRIQKKPWAIALSSALLVAATFVPWGWTAVFPIVGAYLIFVLAFTRIGSLHRFGRYGDFSYGTYLYAFPIQQMVMQAIGHPVAPWILFLYATPLTLIAAVGSWYGVERWFLPRARKKEALVHLIEPA